MIPALPPHRQRMRGASVATKGSRKISVAPVRQRLAQPRGGRTGSRKRARSLAAAPLLSLAANRASASDAGSFQTRIATVSAPVAALRGQSGAKPPVSSSQAPG